VTSPRVSIALLTKNGEATLPALLDAVWRQRTSTPIEVIAVDSGSTDSTRRLLDGRAQKVIAIEPTAFNHGGTRNLAASQSTGDLIVFLAQDALPVSDDWLTHLVAPLLADARVAGTFARQVPREDASPITRHYLSRSVGAGTEAWASDLTGGDWQLMSPRDRFQSCVFDNVCSCIRRTDWIAHPFPETPIAEDVEWARDVLRAGRRVAYVPAAEVVHSHDRSSRYEYRRTYLLHRRLHDLFELHTIPTLPLLARSMASSLATHVWCERANPAAWPRAAALAVAWPAGQYLGARASVLGRAWPKWPAGTV
jgi:GT2 family glycosyltransferase